MRFQTLNKRTRNRVYKAPASVQLAISELNFKKDTNEETKAIIDYLNMSGWHVWRNNTYGLYDAQKQAYRKLQYQQKGVSDVIGFRLSDAKCIAVEFKNVGDSLRPEQVHYLDTLHKSGGYAFVVCSFDEFLDKYNRKMNSS